MAKVAIFGVTGKSGTTIKTELLQRGHEVIGIARDVSKVPAAPGLTIVEGNTESDFVTLFSGADIVVSAYSPGFDESVLQTLPAFTQKLIDGAKAAGVKRVLFVGGAGGLTAPDGGLVINQSW
jgi:putative NADH-flavin reductase